ncbi:hypothetical protein Salat_1968400 [Sesamum alatum]|uniref:Pectinesterase inhibitor domain-containing protein n=1 Tax=Sesamum alatum TaxID=300844 RepID=A0AAE1Y5B5_9LAMI|nr:hypothetical protein Salat_1968400 [Sesamum alatum]
MGFTKTPVSFALAVVATFLLISVADSAVNPFCSTAKDKVLCTQMVKNARTWEQAMTNALNAALVRAKAGKKRVDSIPSKLPADLEPHTKESIHQTCQEAYETIIDNISKSIGFVKYDPTSALDTYLWSTTFSDCIDGLDEFEVSVAEATNFNREMTKLSGILLAVAGKKP